MDSDESAGCYDCRNEGMNPPQFVKNRSRPSWSKASRRIALMIHEHEGLPTLVFLHRQGREFSVSWVRGYGEAHFGAEGLPSGLSLV